ncbi:MAG TPA: hypothetical protein VJU84_05345 [Pyrinomonadaceae bacterium]|nr:hypothetical protein [Pyrinomonadaceae bacterium]
MAEFFLIVFVLWVIGSTMWDGREANKKRILAEMREAYSKQEALNLVSEMKSHAMIIYLAYGTVIGALFSAVIRKAATH